MPTILLGAHPGAKAGDDQKLKRSFYVSLGIHAGLILAVLIVSAIPRKFHFEQTALIELQGLSMPSGSAGAAASTTTKQSVSAPQLKAPPMATLKSTAKIARATPKVESAPEKISLKPFSKPAKQPAKPIEPRVDLKDRILQKFQSLPGRTATAIAGSAISATAVTTSSAATQAIAGIGTDVPFPFASYLAEVRDRITELWQEPAMLATQAQGAQATVVFRIQRDGAVSKVLLAIPSGITLLDRSAVQAVESANPLPPLPQAFGSDYLDVHLQFDLLR